MIKYKKIKGGYWKPILPHSIASGEKYYTNFGEVVIHGETVSVWRGEVLLQWNSTRLIRCPKYYVLVLEDDKTFVIDDEKKGDDACDYIEALSIASKRNYPIYLIKRREALKSFRHIRDRVNLPRGAKIVLFDAYQGLKMKKDLTKASFEKKKIVFLIINSNPYFLTMSGCGIIMIGIHSE